jgi:hypothetical protein
MMGPIWECLLTFSPGSATGTDSGHSSHSTGPLRWGPETIQSPQMEQLGIVINRDHKVVICLVCSSAIIPEKLYEHIHKPGHHERRDFHRGQRLSFATRDFCQLFVRRHKLRNPNLHQPTTIIPPIFGLPIREGFFCCSKCGYAVQVRPSIYRHQRHCEGSGITIGPCQTWFPSSKRQYFAIQFHNLPNPSDPLGPATLFMEQFAFNPYQDIQIQATAHPRDMNIFLTYENWLEEVQGMTGGQIVEIVRNPLPRLRPLVREAVDQYTSKVVKDLIATGPDQRLAIGDYDE